MFSISPGVYNQEVDLSTTIPAVATSMAVNVLRKSYKGDEYKQTLISNTNELVEMFGVPTDDSYIDMLTSEGYLKSGKVLLCTRVMPEDATFASALLLSGYGSNLDPETTTFSFEVSGGSGVVVTPPDEPEVVYEMLLQPGLSATPGSSIVDWKGRTVIPHGEVSIINDSNSIHVIHFDGNGDFIEVVGDYSFMHDGVTPWTMDFIYKTTIDNDQNDFFSTYRDPTTTPGIGISFNYNKGISMIMSNGAGGYAYNGNTSSVFLKNVENHFTITMNPADTEAQYDGSDGSFKIYVNGIYKGCIYRSNFSFTNSPSLNAYVGMRNLDYSYSSMIGDLKAFRIRKGIHWTQSDTVLPTFPFPN